MMVIYFCFFAFACGWLVGWLVGVVVDCIGLSIFCFVKGSYDCKMWPPEAVDCYFISYVINFIGFQ